MSLASDVVPAEPVPAEVSELPCDGWVVVETLGEPSGYGVLRRGDTLVCFHEATEPAERAAMQAWR